MFLENCKKAGSIEVICGSMFSGKTEELIRRMKRAVFANQNVAIYKPAIDVRYSESEVVSHDSHKIASTPISDPKEMLAALNEGIDVLGVDEAQFFDSSIIETVQELANNGIRVIIAGLDTDFLGKPFGPMPSLMAIAEDVLKVHAVCVKCGSPAQHSHRLSENSDLVVLGEKNIYEPLCRHCYNAAIAREAELTGKLDFPEEDKQ
ncbi:MAG: thymidine kinase [Bacteroidales bacterium]|nr:thymidine kinase [Bacteroidales bacterium]